MVTSIISVSEGQMRSNIENKKTVSNMHMRAHKQTSRNQKQCSLYSWNDGTWFNIAWDLLGSYICYMFVTLHTQYFIQNTVEIFFILLFTFRSEQINHKWVISNEQTDRPLLPDWVVQCHRAGCVNVSNQHLLTNYLVWIIISGKYLMILITVS